MKLRKFDFKLPSEDKRRNKVIVASISMVVLILIITIASTFAYYQSIETQTPINANVGTFSSGDIIFAVTIDGVLSNSFPVKGSGYAVESILCDKGASGRWNRDEWSITTINLTQSKTTCNVSFIDERETLRYKILSQFGGELSIEEAPINTFANVSAATDKLMYKMEDDYGDSYYYRGTKTLLSNNLIFAGFQWKIVRINGNGSVRLIYNGICPNNSCTINNTGVVTQVKTTSFNANQSDNKYVGYMYGGFLGYSSTSRIEAITNTTASNMKTEIDNWYVTNIESKGINITKMVSDTLFCNDRQLVLGTGYGQTVTNYGSYLRLRTTRSPILRCTDKNDRFTVSDISVGNGALSYPIGLITADEVSLAGGRYGSANSSYYLYTNHFFWTMSPNEYSSAHAQQFVVRDDGFLYSTGVYNAMGLRPSLNLIPNTLVTGDGSSSNPFVVF